MMDTSPKVCGIQLKYISLVTLTVQNSALTILLHHSRTVVPASEMYSAASAVLLNELLKGGISLAIAYYNAVNSPSSGGSGAFMDNRLSEKRLHEDSRGRDSSRLTRAAVKVKDDVFSSDCWKLSIPACLYVVQNNLQFVAAANLDVPTFQVTYNLKILTTALFSVILLKRRLTPKKWLALFFLAAGVGIVQLQSTAAAGGGAGKAGEHEMDNMKGLLAVACACVTSGLAGVYFEMVLKGSKTDLWIRNVQLSFFSLLPALVPVFFPNFTLYSSSSTVVVPVVRQAIFAHFGFWAWAVVWTQVLGGLVTALVIKYADNIMKGFATSLAIVISFMAGVAIFHFQVTTSFVVGSSVVVGATYLYNAQGPRIHLPPKLPTSVPASPTMLKNPSHNVFESEYHPQRHLSGTDLSSHSGYDSSNTRPAHLRRTLGPGDGSQTPDLHVRAEFQLTMLSEPS